jgi:NADPH-dependent 2,4-dienoyl-CoA reductase/sulfur reductase-like enzyme/nitrite reductase/ring-hydroxylating ferredoxin subunit
LPAYLSIVHDVGGAPATAVLRRARGRGNIALLGVISNSWRPRSVPLRFARHRFGARHEFPKETDMAEQKDDRPDFRAGVSLRTLPDSGMLVGRVDEDEVVLAKVGDELFAVGAHCTHYHGPLGEGLLAGDTVRCPWHHACFSLRTGEPLRAPALDPIDRWRVDRQGDMVFVREKIAAPSDVRRSPSPAAPESIVIVGGGAAGLAAADMLRREGYGGPLTIVSADQDPPCDRPNLSKDFLAGTAQPDWIPLRAPEYYTDNRIDLLLGTAVKSIDTAVRQVRLADGRALSYGALLLATGADPVRLTIPGADGPRVHYLRSFADSRALVEKTTGAKRVAVAGGSFIGLEVAASLRTRGIDVEVIAPETAPLERVMGAEIGGVIRKVHESHGVVFHLGETVTRVDDRTVTMKSGKTVDADVIVFGVGVHPSVALAEQAGLKMDRGIAVDEYLQTSAPGVFAAGDVARWPDARTGARVRVEHWVVAERQGQAAARNILGRRQPFVDVPFFWSQHYDLVINYVGHAQQWDAVRVDGTLDPPDCTVAYMQGGRRLALASIGRDLDSLKAELAMEQESERA